jgi:hypothetical protein
MQTLKQKPGPKPEAWKTDFLAVSYFVWRCLHDDTRHWTFDRIADFVWDYYHYRLTLREFEHIRACKRNLLEFRTATRKHALSKLRAARVR